MPYVWREAFDGDAVCVTVDRRTQAHDDNAHAQERRVRNQRSAPTMQQLTDLNNAFSRWMDANHVANGSMAIMRNDALVGEFDMGEQGPPRAPRRSLFEAITAVA